MSPAPTARPRTTVRHHEDLAAQLAELRGLRDREAIRSSGSVRLAGPLLVVLLRAQRPRR
jgi:hypothetical protein